MLINIDGHELTNYEIYEPIGVGFIYVTKNLTTGKFSLYH